VNPFQKLLKSRKFWLMILDLVVSLALFFVGRFAPGSAEDVKYVIGLIQPVFVTIIAAIAYEDANYIAPVS
jgi:hypothetical protein